MKTNRGFTLVELVIAMGIFSVISVASVWLVFLSLSVRDLTSATTKTEEAIRVFGGSFREATQNASTVVTTGNSLLLKSSADCWSFVYDASTKGVKYDHQTTVGCNPTPDPVKSFFPSATVVNSFLFSVNPLSTGGRLIMVSGSLSTTLPFSSYTGIFSKSITNVID